MLPKVEVSEKNIQKRDDHRSVLFIEIMRHTVKAAKFVHLIPNSDWSKLDFLVVAHVTECNETRLANILW